MNRTFALPLLLAAAPAQGTAPADLGEIERAAAGFAGEPVLPLDPRLRLAGCPQPLALAWYGPQRDMVLVQCPAASGWRLYLQLARRGAAAKAPAITRGDPVSIRIGGAGFAVSQAGEALEAGAIGTWIKVRTLSGKGAPLRARVLRAGLVGIALP